MSSESIDGLEDCLFDDCELDLFDGFADEVSSSIAVSTISVTVDTTRHYSSIQESNDSGISPFRELD